MGHDLYLKKTYSTCVISEVIRVKNTSVLTMERNLSWRKYCSQRKTLNHSIFLSYQSATNINYFNEGISCIVQIHKTTAQSQFVVFVQPIAANHWLHTTAVM